MACRKAGRKERRKERRKEDERRDHKAGEKHAERSILYRRLHCKGPKRPSRSENWQAWEGAGV